MNAPRFRAQPKSASPFAKYTFVSTEVVKVPHRRDGTVVETLRTRTYNSKRNQLKALLGYGKQRKKMRAILRKQQEQAA